MLRFAIIGCGHAGRRHAQQFARIADAELVACCDSSAQAAAAMAEQFGATPYSDVRALLKTPLDGVTICTPPSTHTPIVAAALKQGIHVLCEKPLAISTDDCMPVAGDDSLACAFKFRHLSGAALLRDMIADGALGRILALRATAVSNADMTGKWFSNPALSGGGVLLDNGVHLIDLCHFLAGPIEDVAASAAGGTRGLPVEETASLRLQMACGATADIFVSWEAPAPMPPLLEVYGTQGFARLGYELQVFDAAGKLMRHVPAEGVDIWHEVIANFVGFVAGRELPSAGFEDGFHAVAVAEAGYRSIETGRRTQPRCVTATA